VSAVKYGPDDTWPTHDKKHWHEPLAAARRAGWTLTYVNAPHRFGVVNCPANEHSFVVDKTAKGSETKHSRTGTTPTLYTDLITIMDSWLGRDQLASLAVVGAQDQLKLRACR
jgi:hypothetical protein